ncbi:hypothetical protein EM595_2770 [Duffyella gerundensis]|uniref:Uncharacterized protein n=1 Tax=Duffyella gerundensis TaxID=1619313 RepID=A0A0U5L2L3_9GAMM|nr:hypothetical protein EM595_2770 [Duffyella gerundensis]
MPLIRPENDLLQTKKAASGCLFYGGEPRLFLPFRLR